MKLKLDELHLAYELKHKKQQDKEEQRVIREDQREFEKAKKELGLVRCEELEKLNTQIVELQKNLQEAHEAKERAISRAQETKSIIKQIEQAKQERIENEIEKYPDSWF